MKTPYLIQRAKFQNRDKAGIDRLLRFDYMGSFEFEHGVLPQSLLRIRANIQDYKQFDYSFGNGKTVTVLCKDEDAKDMPDVLVKLSINYYRLKEYCDLDLYLKDNQHHNDFWWDIKNDYMFWKKNDDFTKQFINAL